MGKGERKKKVKRKSNLCNVKRQRLALWLRVKSARWRCNEIVCVISAEWRVLGAAAVPVAAAAATIVDSAGNREPAARNWEWTT